MKKILTAILMVLAVTFMSLGLVACSNKPATITEGNMTFTLLKDKTYALTSYSGEEQEVTVPATIQGYEVSTIATNAFKDNQAINSIKVEEGITTLEEDAINNCVVLTELDLPRTLTNITVDSVSEECTSIDSLKIPANAITSLVTSNRQQQMGNRVLRYVVVKRGVAPNGNVIPFGAFSDAYRIEANGPQQDAAHGGRSLKTAVIEDGITISDKCFQGCYNLESIVLPKDLKRLGNGFFSHAEKVTSIDIPDSVTEIGSSFGACYRLTELKLPKSLKTIGDDAFSRCYNLTKLIIPEFTQFEECDEFAFSSCPSLFVCYNLSNAELAEFGQLETTIREVYNDLSTPSSYYVDQNGYGIWAERDQAGNLIPDTTCYLLHYIGGHERVTLDNLPQNIHGSDYEIYDYAFYRYNTVEKVVIPQAVTKLGVNCLAQTNNSGTLSIVTFEDSASTWRIFDGTYSAEVDVSSDNQSKLTDGLKKCNTSGFNVNGHLYSSFWLEKDLG